MKNSNNQTRNLMGINWDMKIFYLKKENFYLKFYFQKRMVQSPLIQRKMQIFLQVFLKLKNFQVQKPNLESKKY